MASMSPILELARVSKRFGGVHALSEVDLSARTGEVLGLIGPNGAGKSTLVGCITGVLPIDGGVIRFEGREIREMSAHRRARIGISRTFQKIRLADPLTVYENVAAGLAASWFRGGGGWLRVFTSISAPRVADPVRRALERTGLTDVAGVPVKSLPFGKRHSVELARALVLDPKLLLLDEPATGLTDAERERLCTLVRDVAAGGCAVVLVEHDLELVGRLCDQVTVINHGRRIYSGSPAGAQKDPEVVTAYLGSAKLAGAR